jgi:hypothetical protein
MKTKQILKELIDEYGLEYVFEILEVSPEEALLELYEIGSIDLERLIEHFNNDEEQDD